MINYLDLVSLKLIKELIDTFMEIKYIDLFAGIGGFNIGFKEACKAKKISSQCVFTSEIKETAKEKEGD